MATTTKAKDMLYTAGACIDAHWGPWASKEAYETWIQNTAGMDIPESARICVKNADNTFTVYIREKGAWRVDGGTPGVSKAYVDGEVAKKLDKTTADGYYQPKGTYLIPSSLNGYATEEFVQTATASLASKSYVQTQIANALSPDGGAGGTFATQEYVNTELTKYQPKGSYATTEQLAAKADASALSGKLDKNTADGYYQPKGEYLTYASLTDYATKSYVQTEIANALSPDGGASGTFATQEFVTTELAKYQPKGNYATTEQLAGKLDKSTADGYYQEKGAYLTEASLNGYATEEYVNTAAGGVVESAEAAVQAQLERLDTYLGTILNG